MGASIGIAGTSLAQNPVQSIADSGIIRVKSAYPVAETVARLSEAELFAFVLLPGFSTREEVSETSGRGVGLDAVR